MAQATQPAATKGDEPIGPRILHSRNAGYAAAVLSAAVITALCAPFHDRLNNTTVALAYLLAVLFASMQWGTGPGRVAAVLGVLCFNFFFLPPLYTLRIAEPQNWVALAAFLTAASMVGHLSARAAQRAKEAEARAGEAEAWMTTVRGSLVTPEDLPDTGVVRGMNRFVCFASLFSCAVGLLGLIGWMFHIAILKNITPGQVVIKPNTAVCLLLIGLSLWLLRKPDHPTAPGTRRFGQLLASIAAMIGSLSLTEYLFGWDLGIDQLLFYDPSTAAMGSVRPGLMAPITALCFLLLGLALLIQDWTVSSNSRRHWPAQALAALAGVASFIGFLDFLLESRTSLTHMALQTAVALFLFSLGTICSRPGRGVAALMASSGAGGRLIRQLLPAAFFVPILIGVLSWRAVSLGLRSEWGGVTLMIVVTILLLGALTVSNGSALDHSDTKRRRAEQADAQLAAIVASSDDAIISKTLDERVLTWNRASERIFGYKAREMVGQHISILVPPDKKEELREVMARLKHGESTEHLETVRVRKDGQFIYVSVTISPIRNAGGEIVAAATLSHDITARKRAEEQLLRINRAHRALSSCNEALIRTTDESAWLDQICQIIVDKAGYRFCWVGFAEQEDPKAVRPFAHAGFDDGYLQTLNITWADTERGRGPTGTCIRTGETQVTTNTATDPRMAPWRAEALKRGYASSIAIPLFVDSKPFGALTIYSSETEAFGSEEVTLLSELAGDLGYGISVLRTRAARIQAMEEIRSLNAGLEQRIGARTAELQRANLELEQAREREGEIGFRIQQTLLLDQPPRNIPSLRVAALTIPSQRIGGDFYIFLRHSEECLDVIIGDVMGKGIPGALLGAATKSHILRALSDLMAQSKNGAIPEPKEIVTLAHANLVRHLIELDSFVTLCYARLDVKTRSLTCVDCGHTGILQLHGKTGLCEILHGDNLPLGFREGEIYDQTSVPLHPGDQLIFFSDGITEARNSDEELFGVERLEESVRRNGHLEPEALVQSIRNEVFAYAESDPLADDLTCVGVRVEESLPSLARAEMDFDSDLNNLPAVREFVRTFCSGLPNRPLEDEDTSALVLAVDEAVSNIVKHAYQGHPDQRIHIEAEAFPNRLSIRLHHIGDPVDLSKVPPPSLDGSRDSGFGIFIISRSVDEVRYYRDERGRNCVEMVKNWIP